MVVLLAVLEIYEFPEDTMGAELTQHFFEQCQAQCKTSDTNIDEGRKTTHIFSMEFLQSGKPHCSLFATLTSLLVMKNNLRTLKPVICR